MQQVADGLIVEVHKLGDLVVSKSLEIAKLNRFLLAQAKRPHCLAEGGDPGGAGFVLDDAGLDGVLQGVIESKGHPGGLLAEIAVLLHPDELVSKSLEEVKFN